MKLLKKFLNRFFLGIKLDQKYQWGVVDFIFDGINLLFYKSNKISFKCCGSNINSPDWVKNIFYLINRKKKNDDKCFENATMVALN